MSTLRIGAVLAGLALGASALAAQQTDSQSMPHRPGRMMHTSDMAMHARMMDSLDARLDTLVNRMNQATGNSKMNAMADLLRELVAQRKVMRSGAYRMMQSHEGRMRRPAGAAPPADSTGSATGRPPR